MRNTSGIEPVECRKGRPRRYRAIGRALVILIITATVVFQAGCVELVHWGHISDRDNSWAVNAVTISQHQPDGTWQRIGTSDGKGRWEVFKENIKGGGNIKVDKEGYYTIVMPESEFLQSHVILMQAKGGEDFGDSAPSEWMN